jgi:iron complex outermembrane receptor protein
VNFTDRTSYSFNPYQKTTGSCGPNAVYSLSNSVTATSITENCAFDFVSTIDILPESTRDALFASGQFKVNDAITLFSDVALTRQDLIARIAPNPVPIAISTSSEYFNTYIRPHLTAEQLAKVQSVSASYRAVDFGTRDSQTITDTKHLVGTDANLSDWDITSALTRSQYSIDERYIGGYFKKAEFNSLIASNAIDPFVPSGSQSAETQQLIANSIFNGTIRKAETTLTGVDFRASRQVYELPDGAVSLGLGGDLRNYHFQQTPDQRAVNGEIYNYAAVPQFELERKTAGVFGEVLVPVTKDLEVTGAARFDAVSAVRDRVAGTIVGSRMDATTAKLSTRFQPTPALLFRGSYGTGFKAPDMLDIARPVTPSGVTAASYNCPFAGTVECKPGKAQYSRLSGGNPALKPEKSKQAAAGMRFEPSSELGFGFDYWKVEIRDAVSAVSESLAFSDPAKYRELFTTYRTPAETQDFWAFILSSTNIGKSITSGIDWDVVARTQTDYGRLTTSLTGTYLIESSYSIPGTDTLTSSLGKYGINAAVSFRNIVRATATLDTGNISNSLTIKARSGYTDKTQTVRDLSTGANTTIALHVPHYVTLDWQGTYKYSEALELRAGIKNLLNEEPPLTLRDSSGHQVGYDPRYADALLRTLSLSASYKF